MTNAMHHSKNTPAPASQPSTAPRNEAAVQAEAEQLSLPRTRAEAEQQARERAAEVLVERLAREGGWLRKYSRW